MPDQKVIIKTHNKIVVTSVIALMGLGVISLAWSFIPSINKKINAGNSQLVDTRKYSNEIKHGCYLQINDKEILLADAPIKDDLCKNLAIAVYYFPKYNRTHLFNLLNYLSATYSIKNFSVSANDFSNADSIKISEYLNNISITYADYIKSKISSPKCEEINYFGIKVRCFNEFKNSSGEILKKDTTAPMIEYLTFLKYSSQKIKFPATNVVISPFSYFVDKKITIYDASNPDIIKKDLEITMTDIDPTCHEGVGAHTGGTTKAEYAEKKSMFICPKHLPDIEGMKGDQFEKKIVHIAGILYHEALHFDLPGHDYKKDGDTCVQDTKKQGDADWDMSKSYGGQIIYLFDISQNDKLSCIDRKSAYDDAIFNLSKVCTPQVWKYSKPLCD